MRIIDADALKEAITDATYNFEQIPIRVDKVQEIIDNAPTVEFPESITIKCDTEEDKQKLLSALRNAKLKAIIEDDRSQGKWIPVSERLPKEEGEYLVTVYDEKFKRIDIAWFDLSYYKFNHGFNKFATVIAWQPLPEPYEEVEKDGH